MRVLRWVNVVVIIAFLSACKGGDGPIFGPSATSTLPTAAWTIVPAPDARAAATKYLEALQKDDFETMYNLLAQESRDAITLEDYSKRWNDSLNQMSAKEI